MKTKPVIPRALANQDVEEALTYYLQEAGDRVALGFIEALEKAYADLGRHAQTGSPRYASELGLPDLRFWSLSRYPYLIFYIVREDHIDVWRVLKAQRDIPAWLLDDQSSPQN